MNNQKDLLNISIKINSLTVNVYTHEDTLKQMVAEAVDFKQSVKPTPKSTNKYSAYQREWKKKNKEKYNAYMRAYNQKKRDQLKGYTNFQSKAL